MSVIFLEGFDNVASNADQQVKGWSVSSIALVTGRFGTGQASTAGNGMFKNFGSNEAVVIMGAAVKQTDTNAHIIWSYNDGVSIQVDIRSTALQAIQITRNGTVLATSSSAVFSTSVYFYLEFKATMNGSTGTYAARINGAAIPGLSDGTGANTITTANAYANSVLLSSGGNGSLLYDDMYVFNSAGSVNNDFVGDKRIFTSYPTSAGTTTQLTASAGSNYTCVDETTPNGDTDYVSSTTIDQFDTYNVTDLPSTATGILAVVTNLYARKDDASARNVTRMIRSGVTNYTGSDTSLNATYAFYPFTDETDPNTSAAWTLTNFNNAEFGAKVR